MPVSIYAATVPAFLQILECQTSLIHKAASHAHAKGIPHHRILRARLGPHDHSFRTHIRLGTKTAIQTTAMLSGKKAQLLSPPFDSFEALARFVSAAKNYFRSLKEDQFREAENKIFLLKAEGSEPVEGTAVEVVISQTFPIFYYHTVSAHAVLTHFGLPLNVPSFTTLPVRRPRLTGEVSTASDRAAASHRCGLNYGI